MKPESGIVDLSAEEAAELKAETTAVPVPGKSKGAAATGGRTAKTVPPVCMPDTYRS